MSNVLGDDKQQQIVALGRLGWSLRRIEEATGVRRETVSGYLKAVGIVVRGRGRPRESKPNPAILPEVSTDVVPFPRPGRAPSASACEPYRELIAEALGRGRNAMAIWQDLVDDHGFVARYASVRSVPNAPLQPKLPSERNVGGPQRKAHRDRVDTDVEPGIPARFRKHGHAGCRRGRVVRSTGTN